MLNLPVEHNGQIFDLVRDTAGNPDRFHLVLNREFDTFDAQDRWVEDVVLSERLGWIVLGTDSEDQTVVDAHTRYNGERRSFWSLNDAVAWIVDSGRPCTHPDGNGTSAEVNGEPVFRCSECSALFTLSDEGVTTVVEFARPHA